MELVPAVVPPLPPVSTAPRLALVDQPIGRLLVSSRGDTFRAVTTQR